MFNKIEPTAWREGLSVFKEAAAKYYAGELSRNDYKGISGRFGSYAQREDGKSMLRLRMTAGRLTKVKLNFIANAVEKYGVDNIHFTTCEAVQLHDLNLEQVTGIMDEALDAGIVTMGGGGDFPRNVMCSPLSGVEQGEYFDVTPYAETAAEYLMNFIDDEKLPRKLKVCFSNSPKNAPHASFRDLGFAAREDGKFDVYSAGGLGNNPKFGVLVAEAVEPENILYYIKAMVLTFRAYGNYENRGRARTRYMQEICGGAENYRKAYLEKLQEVISSGEDLKIKVEPKLVNKKADGEINSCRALPQKQPGLYTVVWHPIGGQPLKSSIIALNAAIADMPDVEVRLSPEETAYITNLTAKEAEKVLEATPDSAKTIFETSVSCIGASICQVGVRDSQALLRTCVDAVAQAGIPDGALPQIHISGCPSSCGTHQTGLIGFRGGVKKVGDKTEEAFVLYVGGCDYQGKEKMGEELGTMLSSRIPEYLVALGKKIAESGKDYVSYVSENPDFMKSFAEEYLK